MILDYNPNTHGSTRVEISAGTRAQREKQQTRLTEGSKQRASPLWGAGTGPPIPCSPCQPPEGRLDLATRLHRADRGRGASQWGSLARSEHLNQVRREGQHRGRCHVANTYSRYDVTRTAPRLYGRPPKPPRLHKPRSTPFCKAPGQTPSVAQDEEVRHCPSSEVATETRSLDAMGSPGWSSGTGKRHREKPMKSQQSVEFG